MTRAWTWVVGLALCGWAAAQEPIERIATSGAADAALIVVQGAKGAEVRWQSAQGVLGSRRFAPAEVVGLAVTERYAVVITWDMGHTLHRLALPKLERSGSRSLEEFAELKGIDAQHVYLQTKAGGELIEINKGLQGRPVAGMSRLAGGGGVSGPVVYRAGQPVAVLQGGGLPQGRLGLERLERGRQGYMTSWHQPLASEVTLSLRPAVLAGKRWPMLTAEAAAAGGGFQLLAEDESLRVAASQQITPRLIATARSQLIVVGRQARGGGDALFFIPASEIPGGSRPPTVGFGAAQLALAVAKPVEDGTDWGTGQNALRLPDGWRASVDRTGVTLRESTVSFNLRLLWQAAVAELASEADLAAFREQLEGARAAEASRKLAAALGLELGDEVLVALPVAIELQRPDGPAGALTLSAVYRVAPDVAAGWLTKASELVASKPAAAPSSAASAAAAEGPAKRKVPPMPWGLVFTVLGGMALIGGWVVWLSFRASAPPPARHSLAELRESSRGKLEATRFEQAEAEREEARRLTGGKSERAPLLSEQPEAGAPRGKGRRPSGARDVYEDRPMTPRRMRVARPQVNTGGVIGGLALIMGGVGITLMSYWAAASKPEGGTYTILYGPVVVGFIMLCSSLSPGQADS